MKVLLLYDYPPSPGGLATQGDLLYKGLTELGVEAHAVNLDSPQEKEWYYRWFRPDIVLGVGYWGHTPQLIFHPQRYGITPVPWLVADGYIANYQETLNSLPLILVTSNWVRDTYIRDGIRGDNIEVLPVGCDTDAFRPFERSDPKVCAVRESLGVADNQVMILTVGGDAASKGGREVMEALALIDRGAPDYKYVCKVWPQARTSVQNLQDMLLATTLGIEKNVVYSTSRNSRDYMPYLLAACDIYAAPSRLEGFGMIQVEANACEKPVIAIDAMAFKDTMVHGQTAYLAAVAQENKIGEATVGEDQGFEEGHRVIFPYLRTADFRASVQDIARHLNHLMRSPEERLRLGQNGRRRVVENYDYRIVAKKFVEIVQRKLQIN
ncbi:MAG TPA: glycosyltransferase family 4 protein [Polyangiaceae bacterium]|nr:glycosyltransferase family 4 protein [Polyangiaceae bacterium]